MFQRLRVHPVNPQPRLLSRAADAIRQGGVVALPTDACYVLGWAIGERQPLERVRSIRALGERHLMTVLCAGLSDLSRLAQVDTRQFRFLKERTPGPFTFILPATREIPRRLLHPSRRTIGLRVPDSAVIAMLLDLLGEPILATTLQLPGEELPLNDPDEIEARLSKRIDALVDAGSPGVDPTTVIDLTVDPIEVLRVGRGDPAIGSR
jgi:tRNA threonylcarbamoyl adenosine modification protein (Sua5/YciO/YrdC/YwlC family)